MCFNFPIPCLWKMCSVAFASIAHTGLISCPKSLNNGTIPFDSDAPNAAAYSSASAQLLAMLSRVCFQGTITKHQHACARRLSSLLASGPVRIREYCQFLSQLPIFKHLSHCLSRFKYLTNLFNLAMLC